MDLDIKGFFDHVNQEILMKLVGQVVKDRRVLGLLHGWLKAGVMEEGKLRHTTSGTPPILYSRGRFNPGFWVQWLRCAFIMSVPGDGLFHVPIPWRNNSNS